MEDQPAGSGDLTTDTEQSGRRRGWRFLRRRSKRAPAGADAAENVDDADSGGTAGRDEAEPAPRKPVGKSRKSAKTGLKAAADEAVDDAPPGEPQTQTVEAEAADADESTDQAHSAEEADTTAEDEPAPEEPVLVPHRPAGRRLKIAAAAGAVLFVAAAAFAGAMLQPYLQDRALVQTKEDIAQTAADAITTLWTYTPENMETLPERSQRYLAGDFATEYRRYLDAIVAANQQAKVSNDTQVMATAVESITPGGATAIVYTNSIAKSPVNNNIPSLRYLSYRLMLERHDSGWMITGMDTLTSLDLTPQL